MPNALRDIAWIETINGRMTPRDALVTAHEIRGGVAGFGDLLSGVAVGSQFRFLMGLAALVVREQGDTGTQFDEAVVDRVVDRLAPFSDPLDADRPFLQCWRPAAEKHAEPSFDPPTKLALGVESNSARAFWSTDNQDWALPQALKSLLEFATYSHASNNVALGRSTWNSSPGRGQVGSSQLSTELIWSKDTLFDALLLNTPKTWVTGNALPFWADQNGEHALEDGGLAPIWYSSWTGNVVIAEWSEAGDGLIGVDTGGAADYAPFLGIRMPVYVAPPVKDPASAEPVTEERAPRPSFEATAEQKTTRKEAVAVRDLNDPLRIIEDRIIKEQLVRTPYRQDPAESATRLLVTWKSKNLSPAMSDRGQRAIRQPGRDGHRIIFLTHAYGGTASSPQLRFSQHRQAAAIEWVDADDRAEEVADLAKRVEDYAFYLSTLFGREKVLENFGNLKDMLLTTYWDEVTAPFTRFITTSQEFILPEQTHADIRGAVQNTFKRMQALMPITNGGAVLLSAAQSADRKARDLFPTRKESL